MKNAETWTPTKFVFDKGQFKASRNPKAATLGSRLIMDNVATLYQRHLPDHAHGHLLDLGCGSVPFYEAYKPYIIENTCVDWAKSLHNQAYLDQEVNLTQPLPFEARSFDTILLSDVLEHIPNPEQLWGEMARILRPNGAIIMNVPFYYWVHEEPHDYYRYTEYALRRFAEMNGLEVKVLESVGGVAEVVTDITAKNLSRLPMIGAPMADGLQRICSFVTKRTSIGRKITHKTGRRFPLGYFMVVRKP